MGETAVVGCVVAGVILLLPAIWLIATFNRLTGIGQHLRESWSDVDVELKRRYDLVPNLVATVKGYAAHEQGVFERVTSLRSEAMAIREQGGALSGPESEFGHALHRLMAVAEQYPVLKADGQFLALQRELALTEDRIAAARRFYNANVRELNSLVATFPSNVVAGLFGFTTQKFFELDDAAERSAPRVSQ